MADLRTADQLLELAKNELGNMLIDSSTAAGDLSILVPAGSIREVLTKLRDADGLRFDLMSYMTVV
ncbi:hypothetical protein KDL29_03795, partial [bacterium]|nr:hypothetical protein [bacterium]